MKELATFFAITAFVGGLPAVALFYLVLWFLWLKKKMVLSIPTHLAAFVFAAAASSVIRFALFLVYGVPILASGPEVNQQAFHLFAPAISVIAILKFIGRSSNTSGRYKEAKHVTTP